MEKERKKALKIAAEIIRYFIDHLIMQMSVDFDFGDDGFFVTVSGRTQEKPHDLDQLAAALQEARQPELDEYYNDLLGTDSKNQGYHLLGAMVDASDVRYDGTTLSVRVGRNSSMR